MLIREKESERERERGGRGRGWRMEKKSEIRRKKLNEMCFRDAKLERGRYIPGLLYLVALFVHRHEARRACDIREQDDRN